MHVPIIRVPRCFSVEVVTMGGGLEKGISINETLIRFPVCFGFKRLLLMQRCDGMWIVCRSRWNLCQRSVSEQGTVDSCQHQHTPGEGKVGRQSWALKRKRTRSSFTPTALRLVRQTDTRIFTHLHTCTDIGSGGEGYLRGGRFDQTTECLD